MRHTREFVTLGVLFVSCVLLAGPANTFGQQTSNDQSTLTLKQVKQQLKQNNQYLKEAEKRGKAGDAAGLQTALNNYDRSMEGLNTALGQGRFNGNPSQQQDAYNRVQTATSKHTHVLEGLLSKVPEQARPHIQHAIEVSQKGHDTALAHLQGLRAQQGLGQENQSGFGRSEGAGRPGGIGGGSPGVGGPGGGGMGHPGGGPSMGGGGGHPGR